MNEYPLAETADQDGIDTKAPTWQKPDKLILKLTLITLCTYNLLFIYQLAIHNLLPNLSISHYDFITNLYVCLAVNLAASLILYRHHQMVQQIEQELARRLRFEQALQQAKGLLEQRVADSTADLERVNQGLRLEITERERVEGNLRTSEEKYRLLVNKMPAVVFTGYMDWAIDLFDDKIEELAGYPKEEFNSRKIKWSQLILEDDLWQTKEKFLQALRGDKVYTREYRIRHKDGKVLWIQDRGQIFCNRDGGAEYVSGVFFDITQAKQAEEDLHQANERLKSLVEESERQNRALTLLNEMSELLQSCQTSKEACATVAIYAPKLFPEDSGGLYVFDDSKDFLVPVKVWGNSPPQETMFPASECWALRRGRMVKADGSQPRLPCEHLPAGLDGYLCVPMIAQGETLGMFHVRAEAGGSPRSANDAGTMTEFKQWAAHSLAEQLGISLSNLKLRESLQRQAVRDPLTGLFNRRYMEETIEREWRRATRLGVPLGLIMMDIDHFKEFNDKYGHGAGDTVLSVLGRLIKAHIREEDVGCRYGGEEFLVILPGASLKVSHKRAEMLWMRIKQLHKRPDMPIRHPISASLGVAVFPDHGATVAELIKAADSALYQAKNAGRNQVITAKRTQGFLQDYPDQVSAVQ
jgi:diguanylate cyclase (GGDEF)-like protein/PAS domain S-box-containing protein